MTAEIIAVEKTYHPHLREQGLEFALDLRCDPSNEGQKFLVKSLKQILENQLQGMEGDWYFSFLGPLTLGKNLSVLQFVAEHEFEVNLGISETWKIQEEVPLPFTEILIACNPALIAKFLDTPKLDFGWDFCLAGYKHSAKKIDAAPPKTFIFCKGDFTPPAAAYEIAFCSSPDWDAIQFFSSDETKLTTLKSQTKL